jgi:hypothetical protein
MSDEAEFKAWQCEHDRLRFEYDQAYFRTVFCPESELKEAEEMLRIWRHKFFSH